MPEPESNPNPPAQNAVDWHRLTEQVARVSEAPLGARPYRIGLAVALGLSVSWVYALTLVVRRGTGVSANDRTLRLPAIASMASMGTSSFVQD